MAGPSVKTVKRLFAVSGNRCAFLGCGVSLVDSESGTVVGEVCHIKADRPSGPRYDSSQSDDERHAFSNLILMCPTHHKIIDSDAVMFTVERLLSIKAEHESSHATGAELADEIAQQLIVNADRVTLQVQHGENRSRNFQIGSLTITSGPTIQEVRDIATDVFQANFLRLCASAASEVERRFASFREQILVTVQRELSTDQLARFRDPDVQFKFYEVLQQGVRTTDESLRARLANLLIERIKVDNQEPLKFLYNEAITTASRLTRDQLDILGLAFVGTHGIESYRFKARNWQEFDAYYGCMIDAFTKRKLATWNVRHLQAAGCLVLDRSSQPFDMICHVAGSNQLLFQRGIPLDRVRDVVQAEDLRERLFAESEDEPGTYVLRSHIHKTQTQQGGDDGNPVHAYSHKFGIEISNELLEKLSEIWQWAMSPLDDVIQCRRTPVRNHIYCVAEKHDSITRLSEMWRNCFFEYRNVELTFVGMTIAQTHVKQETGRRFEINPAVL